VDSRPLGCDAVDLYVVLTSRWRRHVLRKLATAYKTTRHHNLEDHEFLFFKYLYVLSSFHLPRNHDARMLPYHCLLEPERDKIPTETTREKDREPKSEQPVIWSHLNKILSDYDARIRNP
jgi:hypothetical protein